jgi:hypothetical protein
MFEIDLTLDDSDNEEQILTTPEPQVSRKRQRSYEDHKNDNGAAVSEGHRQPLQ